MLHDVFDGVTHPIEPLIQDPYHVLRDVMYDVRVLLAAPKSLDIYGGASTPFSWFDLQSGPCGHIQAFLAYRLLDAGYQVSPYTIQNLPESKFYHGALCADVGGMKLFDPSLPQFDVGQTAAHAEFRREIVMSRDNSPIHHMSQAVGRGFYNDMACNGYASIDAAHSYAYLNAFADGKLQARCPEDCLQFMTGNTRFAPGDLAHCRDEVNIWLNALGLRPVQPGGPQTRYQEIQMGGECESKVRNYGIAAGQPRVIYL